MRFVKKLFFFSLFLCFISIYKIQAADAPAQIAQSGSLDPAQVTVAADAAATKINLADVSNLRAGNAVSYTNNGTGPSPVTTTISAVNADTGEITLTDAVVTGGILLNDPITISYTGARVIEAFTFDGGATVYISVISDF